jgi:hypothetical protein
MTLSFHNATCKPWSHSYIDALVSGAVDVAFGSWSCENSFRLTAGHFKLMSPLAAHRNGPTKKIILSGSRKIAFSHSQGQKRTSPASLDWVRFTPEGGDGRAIDEYAP